MTDSEFMKNSVAHADLKLTGQEIEFLNNNANQIKMTYKQVANFLLVLGRAFHESEQTKQTIESVVSLD